MNQDKLAALHSRYNPQAEAERYINVLSLDEKTRFFILVEPGLGYMIAPLRKKVPGARIIALHADAHPAADKAIPAVQRPDSRWHPGLGMTVQDFLEMEIPDSAAAEIRLLEWRPALALYGSAYLALVEESAEFIKRSDANARTFNAFGKRWLRNFFNNLEKIKNIVRPAPLSLPILVTGAGPSLEDAIPLIRERQGSLFVLAASSSAMSLKAAGIVPDMVISTDGGLWALFHLVECVRGNPISYPFAASLTAALPSQCAALPVLPISDGSLWQTLILKGLNIPFIALPQRGTVSASALDLAFALTSGDIFIAGLDLENSGIRSHVRPYSFERFLEDASNRLNPVYSQTFKRSSLLKDGGSYAIYASWFEKQLAAYPKRLYPLGKNNNVFSAIEGLPGNYLPQRRPETEAGATKAKENLLFPCAPLRLASVIGSEKSLPLKAYEILEKALQVPAHSQVLRKELGPIFPSQDFTEALRTIAHDGRNG